MNKKIIFITLGAGIIGFSGMFALAWFTKPKAPVSNKQLAENIVEKKVNNATPEPSTLTQRLAAIDAKSSQTISDQQLEMLIFEVREKIKEYNSKLRNLSVREKRLEVAQDNLKKDIDEMASLRVELASAVATLKDEQDKLQRSKLAIKKTEQDNLMLIAATYDKMDAESAGKILLDMVKNNSTPSSSDDAVKILYYMTERTKAKVLAQIAVTEPSVSAYICQRLKRTVMKE